MVEPRGLRVRGFLSWAGEDHRHDYYWFGVAGGSGTGRAWPSGDERRASAGWPVRSVGQRCRRVSFLVGSKVTVLGIALVDL